MKRPSMFVTVMFTSVFMIASYYCYYNRCLLLLKYMSTIAVNRCLKKSLWKSTLFMYKMFLRLSTPMKCYISFYIT